MRPLGLVLMEGGGVVLPRPLGEDVVVPDPQGAARELLGDGGDVRVQGQAAQRVAVEPDVDPLDEGKRLLVRARCGIPVLEGIRAAAAGSP